MLQPLFSVLTSGSFCWFLASSLWIYPHSLSYFNESIGGPLDGAEHLLGGNLDCGQDLMYLKDWLRRADSNVDLTVRCVSMFDLASVGIRNAARERYCALKPHHSKLDWDVLSVNFEHYMPSVRAGPSYWNPNLSVDSYCNSKTPIWRKQFTYSISIVPKTRHTPAPGHSADFQ